jgi:hypothetical protein
VNCVNCNGENVVTTNLNLIHFFKLGSKPNFICNIFLKLNIFLIKKNFLPEDQNNSRFPLYLFNYESECHEEKCATCGMCFSTYIKNVTTIN